MADVDKAKAEKLAAAKKRLPLDADDIQQVEQMKKQKEKAKKGGAAKKDKDETPAESKAEESTASAAEAEEPQPSAVSEETPEEPPSPTQTTSSLSRQSKLRSSSFRQGPLSPSGSFPLSPEGETAPEIYRKQVARIEDLEKENKRLAKEAGDTEKRWKKAEEELADLREADRDGTDDSQVEKLKSEIAALQRQNSQLQSSATKRHVSSPSISMSTPPGELQAQLASKSATIETMELEISRLRAQAERQSSAGGTDREQIVALEEKLARAEQAAMKAQRELADRKRNLERTTERAVKEGSERTSAETKLRTLGQDVERLTSEKAELEKKAEALDKKVTALGNLHKEHDSRSQALRKEKERAEKDAQEVKSKVERLEAENARLRKKDAAEGGGDDDGVDELEDEERLRMEKKIRDLESEVYDLRRGIWHQRRRDMESGAGDDPTSPNSGGGFTNIDLGNGLVSPSTSRKPAAKGLGDLFTSGINALTGAAPEEKDELLEDDDLEFDEEAFRRAQEEDAKRRLERIKDIKRGLKNWEGWRLDLVDGRRGGGGYGAGEVFEI
ncbi:Uu.00g100070.m01.CDS01 [Anthostomella pinea]|uniref:Uu.00g100070.m01.CDS01 n=1 Tax=Anthostomella pinea TaxID=933095 RepID=A0AAI8VDG0_9PEZI|nr:Uu.00g100070.m01.CDS01 [Anthostomella pinea]